METTNKAKTATSPATASDRRSCTGVLGQSESLSARLSRAKPIAKRHLRYEGRDYHIRIYGVGRKNRRLYYAAAVSDGRTIKTPPAVSESGAQALFIKLIDPEVEMVLSPDGRRLA